MQARVLGGGIAGLAASYQFLRAKTNVLGYESSSRLGGRVYTRSFGGVQTDVGVQFITQLDQHALTLLRKLRLQKKLVPLFLNRFKWVSDGGLDESKEWRAAERLVKRIAGRSFNQFLERHLSTPFDEWLSRYGLDGNPKIRAACKGVCFAEPQELSTAYGIAVLFSFLAPVWQLEGGWNRLVDGLEKRSNVQSSFHLNTPVTHAVLNDNKVSALHISGKETAVSSADPIVCAVPAPAAARLLSDKKDLRKTLRAVPYMPGAAVVFHTSRKTFGSAPGALTDNLDFPFIFEYSLENGFLAVLFSPKQNPSAASAGRFLSSLSSVSAEYPRFIGLQKWKEAMPLPSPALFALQQQLNELRPSNLFLAGDYMSMPSLDGAVESGAVAARGALDYSKLRNSF